MNKIYCSIAFFLCLFSNTLMATDLPITIKLAYIKAVQVSELGGDELYFNITEYSNMTHGDSMRVPMFPTHWLSRQLHLIKDLPIWQGLLKVNEEKKLILTLIEQDNAPWVPDSLVGSIQVLLKNIGGRLVAQWSVPHYKDEPKVVLTTKENLQTAILNGNGCYEIAVLVEQ